MEKIDPQVASQVWQRVRGQEKSPQPVGVQTMVAWEKETEGALLWLSQRLPEKGHALQQMLADTRRHIACLQGIRQLAGEKKGNYTATKPAAQDPAALLRWCYGQSLRVGGQYASLGEDNQYGCVFSDMARTKRRHCALILELLGTMQV